MIDVIVTDHAAWRAAERLGMTFLEEIERDVHEAILARRIGTKKPTWQHEGNGGCTYAWTEDEQRIYVLRPDTNGYIVITVLPGQPDP